MISVSPSTVCDLIERTRPVVKKASSARAGSAVHTTDTTATPTANVKDRTCTGPSILPRVHERVEHADAQLAWIPAVRGRNQGRHVSFVDGNTNFAVVRVA